MTITAAYYRSPMGLIEVLASDVVTSVCFCDARRYEEDHDSDILAECIRQLDEYFTGRRTVFDIPVGQEGTDFQQNVWRELMNIPFGVTVSYADLAKSLGSSKSVRAVGAANGKNKIWIIVPCHRIIGSDGSLTGYAGGVERKRQLLVHEAQVLKISRTNFTATCPMQLELF